MMKKFKGKAIYNPSGKAGEYSYWACNFYVGCSNGCTYCYLKKGRGAAILGGSVPTLKKCFKDEEHALDIFLKELEKNEDAIRKHGLFFTFSSDPFLEQTFELNISAIDMCLARKIPVKVLTKMTWFVDYVIARYSRRNKYIAFGFTLTGHDELEPSASTNTERVEAMCNLKNEGFKVFASIEPIIDFESSKHMIIASIDYCDLFKIGLSSGKKYDVAEAQAFIEWLESLSLGSTKIYMKESLQKLTGYANASMNKNFVEQDFNMFKE